MGNIRSETFLLAQSFKEALSFKELVEVIKEYNNSIANSNLFFPNQETLQIMYWAKREKISFGPYQNLTFFEISNRIYSDFVLLEAAQILFKEYFIKSIQLKMSNHSGSDLVVIDKNNNEIEGEAFNTAPSFFQIKMRNELNKIKKNNNSVGIIAFNESALNDKNSIYLERKKLEYPNIVFVACKKL